MTNEIRTIAGLKKAITDNNLIIEATGYKGRYKVVTEDGLYWKTVRFANAKPCYPATVYVLDYDFDGMDEWKSMTIDGFLKEMNHTR